MFKNVGGKIKVISVIVLVLLLIASLVGAIVLWATLPRWVDGKFWIGMGTLAGGAVVAVFSSIMLQGYGIIVDAHEVKSDKADPAKEAYTSKLFRDMEEKQEEARKPAGTPAQGEWKCPACGKVNQDYVGTCGCGQLKP